ncbi:MAG: rod shape-determining protein MreC [Sphingomonas bacterium]|nr:rod shape-determining protein MreC [Sphingomonas bacterium]MDB5688965.1 rod shape-determining protein MreC [Sphingomonas bacterium]
MAPPRNRQPGFSRRAQYGLFAGYVVAVAGVFVGVTLILMAQFDRKGFEMVRMGVSDVTTPGSSAGRSGVRGVRSVGQSVIAYFDAANQNRRLRDEIARSRIVLTQARILVDENRRLKHLLQLAENTPERVAATRIVASTAMGIRRFATIDAGYTNGVRTGQPVRSPEGLIGRVIEVGATSARLMLLSDGGNTVPVRLARGGAPALVIGSGGPRLDLRGLAAGASPFRRGDLVVTSGTGGVYPPGIPVAVVTRVSGDRAEGMPVADPARVEFALVLRSAPALPAPSPAPAAAQ